MTNKYAFIMSLVVLFVGACKKKPATEIDPLFIAIWTHNSSPTDTKYLKIRANSKGGIEEYENGQSQSVTKDRKWLIKNNTLYFGWTGGGNEKFSIDQYPLISVDTIITDFDTVYPNQKYMILDGNYYLD
jgi:hypothetical protein